LGIANLRISIHDTEWRSAEAARAEQQYGITSRPVTIPTRQGTRTDNLYLGVAVTCGLERVTLPFLAGGMSAEYELVRSLYSVGQQRRLRVGVLVTDASVLGGLDPQTGAKTPDWPIIDELRKHYKVVRVDPARPLTDRYDVLLVAQPSSLGPQELDHLVAAVGQGQPTLVFEDPFPFFTRTVPGTAAPRQTTESPMLPMFMRPSPAKGDCRKLWDLLGVKFSSEQVVCQAYNPYLQVSETITQGVR
jgi:hypothetical protein